MAMRIWETERIEWLEQDIRMAYACIARKLDLLQTEQSERQQWDSVQHIAGEYRTIRNQKREILELESKRS